MPFRDDILRGVRFFLIAFAVVLLGVWVYRMVSAPEAAAEQNAPALYEAATPEQPAAPIVDDPSEPHGLAVPPPPAVPGAHPVRAVRHPRNDNVPPPPPLVRAHAAAPPERKSDAPAPTPSPAAPAEQTLSATSLPADNGTAANADPSPEQPAVQETAPVPIQKPQKGNRFTRALGRMFHVGAPKDKMQLTLQPKQP